MSWTVKVGAARSVTVRSKAAADRAVADARRRYENGAKSLQMVRVIDPEGRLTIIDFAREAALRHPALEALEQSTQARERARQALERSSTKWDADNRAAVAAGVSETLVAAAAATTAAHVRSILRRN